MHVLVQILLGYYSADLLTGIHWIEDTYLEENTPYVGVHCQR
jgi:hypothetical protein